MKKFAHNVVKIKDPETGKWEGLPTIVGESAYELAVRLGTFGGTEEEYNNFVNESRDAAIAAVEQKGVETLETIPDDYTQLQEDVRNLMFPQPIPRLEVTDLDTVTKSGWYNVYNNPTNSPAYIGNYLLLVFNISENFVAQVAISTSNNRTVKIRYYGGGVWNDWKSANDYIHQTASSNDFNNIKENGWYYMDSTEMLNGPTGEKCNGILEVRNEESFTSQLYIDFESGVVYIRYYDAEKWNTWAYQICDYRKVITITPDDDLYEIVNTSYDTHFKVMPGEYDITEKVNDKGELWLRSGCWLEGCGDVTIKCNMQDLNTTFSVIRLDKANCKISNVTLEGSNLRYVIHDDVGGTETKDILHEIINCKLIYNGDAVGWTPRAIGGGCGNNATIIIDSCICECAYSQRAIDYHSNYSVVSDPPTQKIAKGKLIIKNCYSETGDIYVHTTEGDNGSLKDDVILANNCVKGSVQCDDVSFNPMIWNNVDNSK